MSNFFAALDDSDNEGKAPPAPAIATKKTKATPPTKPEVVEPSKVVDRRPSNDRKGGRGGRVPSRDGKRTHDRRSGTGRGKEIKKGGGGGHNWGSDQNDAKKAEGAVTEDKEDDAIAAAVEENEPVAEEEEEVVEAKEPEPEDNTMSYDDYVAQKARPDTEAFKPLEERAVENEFSGKAAAKKETEDFLVMGGGKQPKKKGSGKKEKETLVLDFKVKSAISDDRGDRGGGGRREGGRRSDGGRNGGDRRDSGRREGRGGRDGRGGGADRGGRRDRGDWSIQPMIMHSHHFREREVLGFAFRASFDSIVCCLWFSDVNAGAMTIRSSPV